MNREEFLETVKKAQTSQQSSEITRLKNRLAEPKYAELCRRFLADSEDFCEENLKQAGMTLRFENVDFEECVSKVCKYIEELLDSIEESRKNMMLVRVEVTDSGTKEEEEEFLA